MRHVVYLLLVANLLYLGWNLSRSEVEPDPAASWPALPETVSTLVTLEELPQQSAAGMGQATFGQPAAPVAAIETMKPELVTQNGPPGAGRVECLELGPFRLHDEVRSVVTRLDALGLEARERAVKAREQDGYWVYLPVRERDAAHKVIAMLQQHGDKDYFLGRDNVVALGTFSDIEHANLRQGQMRELGLEAMVAPHAVVRETWWLEFQQPGDDVMDDILQQHPELRRRSLTCP
jgi:hypothetical protein